MNKKVLITDYDGTLGRTDGTVSEQTVAAIKKFVSDGGIFIVCTGRMKASILPIVRKITGKGYVMAFNGAEISEIESGKDIIYTPIDNSVTVKALKIIEEEGLYVQSYYDDKIIIDKSTPFTQFYEGICGVKATEINENLVTHYERTGYESTKLLVFDLPEKVDKSFDRIFAELKDDLKVIRSNPYHIEITQKDVSKGNAVRELIKILNINADDVITVGDSGNDIPMLEGFKNSFAVLNALDNVKKVVNVVLPVSSDEDAIKYLIEN